MDVKPLSMVPHHWADAFGITVAFACAIQCAAFPLLVSLLSFPALVSVLSFVGPELFSGGLEKIFLVTAVALAAGSFSWGFRFHRRLYIFFFLVAASGMILIGRLWFNDWHQIPFVVSGSLVLAAGHTLNRRLCRLCAACAGRAENESSSAR